MPFPISLNGKLELPTGLSKPERLRDAISSSLNSLEGCTARTDGLTTWFTCYWSFRKGRGDLADFSKGMFNLQSKENSIVIEYQLSLLTSFLITLILGGLLFLSIVLNIRKEFTSSPVVPPIVFLLWWAPYITDYIQKRKKIHRFLNNCVHDATEQVAK